MHSSISVFMNFSKSCLQKTSRDLWEGWCQAFSILKSPLEINKSQNNSSTCVEVSTAQQCITLSVNSDSFSIQKFIVHFHPSTKEHSAKWHNEIERTVAVLLFNVTWKQWQPPSIQIPWESMTSLREKCRAFRLTLGRWDKADVETLAWKGPQELQRSEPVLAGSCDTNLIPASS